MPLFHFYLIEGDKREHVGSLDLPHKGEALPAGLQLTLKVLASTARIHGTGDGVLVQATDDAEALVYSFNVQPQTRKPDEAKVLLH